MQTPKPAILKVQYAEKLFDPRWAQKRKEILKRDQYCCVICKVKSNKLQVHHKQYHFIKRLQKHVDPWDYAPKYLISLCESCHQRGHYHYDVPIKYI